MLNYDSGRHRNSMTYTRRLTPGARLGLTTHGNRDPKPVDRKLNEPLRRRVLEDLAMTKGQQLPSSLCRNSQGTMECIPLNRLPHRHH